MGLLIDAIVLVHDQHLLGATFAYFKVVLRVGVRGGVLMAINLFCNGTFAILPCRRVCIDRLALIAALR